MFCVSRKEPMNVFQNRTVELEYKSLQSDYTNKYTDIILENIKSTPYKPVIKKENNNSNNGYQEIKINEDITSLQQCNVDHILYILNKSGILDNPKFTINGKSYKKMVLSYFKQKQIDGQTINKLTLKQFRQSIITFCENQKKLNGILATIYLYFTKKLDNDNDIFPLPSILPSTTISQSITEHAEEPLHDGISNNYKLKCLNECSSVELITVFNDNNVFKDKNEYIQKLYPYKEKIVLYFTSNNIDGQKLLEMQRKEFIYSIAHYVGNKKLVGPLGRLYSKLHNNFQIKVYEMETVVRKMELKDVNHEQIVFVLKHCIFDDLKDQDKQGKLQEYKNKIIQYFEINDFLNGQYIQKVKRKDFAINISEYCEDKKVNASTRKIYSAFIKFKWNEDPRFLTYFSQTTEQKQTTDDDDTNNKQTILSLPDDIEKCNNNEIIFILNQYIFNHFDDKYIKSLNPEKDKIIEYFINNKIDGRVLCSKTMRRKDFARNLYEALGGDKKKNGACLRLHSILNKFDLGRMKIEYKMESVNEIKDCNIEQLLFILNKKIFKDNNDKHIQKLIAYKQEINEYFVNNKIDGKSLCDSSSMNRKDFAKDLYQTLGDKKLNGACLRLYDKLSKYDLKQHV